MRTARRWITLDGIEHQTAEAGQRHTEVQYTKAVSDLAGRLVTGDFKYQGVKNFIHQHLAEFVALQALKDDMKIPETADGEGI